MASGSSSFFLVARIGRSQRLLELSTIREIVPAMRLTVPPGVGGACCGVANVRGEVMPVFDVLARGEHLDPSQLIVIAHGHRGQSIGVVVDDVADIVELPEERVVEYGAGLGRSLRSANLDGEVVTVLSVSEVLDAV